MTNREKTALSAAAEATAATAAMEAAGARGGGDGVVAVIANPQRVVAAVAMKEAVAVWQRRKGAPAPAVEAVHRALHWCPPRCHPQD